MTTTACSQPTGASRTRWLKKSSSATDEIIYIVPNGYELRYRLSRLGFSFDNQLKQWTCAVRRDQVEWIGRIEALWNQTDREAPAAAVDPQPGRRRAGVASELPLIQTLLVGKSWLYPAEISILQSLRRQALSRPLSQRQLKTLRDIGSRLAWRQGPTVYPGGSPGLGKRRR